MVTAGRADEGRSLLRRVGAWAATRPDVEAIALVGSWAKGAARIDSDIDLVVLTTVPDAYLQTAEWVVPATGEAAATIRIMTWGSLLTERRLRLASGLEIEFGFTTREWARTDPVDEGTRQVVADGCVTVYDPNGLVARLIHTLRRAPPGSAP